MKIRAGVVVNCDQFAVDQSAQGREVRAVTISGNFLVFELFS
jgi:hypothetical protein